jgi:hypothetical protein
MDISITPTPSICGNIPFICFIVFVGLPVTESKSIFVVSKKEDKTAPSAE